MNEQAAKAHRRLPSIRGNPKAAHYEEAGGCLSPANPRVVRIDAVRELLAIPHPDAPKRPVDTMLNDPDREFRMDIMEQPAKTKGKNVEKIADKFHTFPIEVRKKLAFSTMLYAAAPQHPSMKKALEGTSEVRDMATGKAMGG